MSTVAYEIVDEHTDRPFAGDRPAAGSGAENLGHRPAADPGLRIDLSETVLPLPVPTAYASRRVRSFTAYASRRVRSSTAHRTPDRRPPPQRRCGLLPAAT